MARATNFAVLILFVLACESAGWVGSIFTLQSIPAWYQTLLKPPFAPPDWVFAPVWLALYLVMGVAAYLVWEKMEGKSSQRASSALNMFGIQLILNALWSVAFFGLRSPLLGLAVIILLLLAIALTIYRFHSIDRRAAWLMAPYIVWVCFAALLNFYIFALNP